MMVCPLYKDIRRKYISNISWPTVNKFIRIMSTMNKTMVLNIAHFLDAAFELRTEILSNVN